VTITVRHLQPCPRCSAHLPICDLLRQEAERAAQIVEDVVSFGGYGHTPDAEIVVDCHSFAATRRGRPPV
jgi:hypothetical protein